MAKEYKINIPKNSKCKIIKENEFFLTKYGTATPEITIEDTARAVFDSDEWIENITNPSILYFLTRALAEGRELVNMNEDAYYGKITSLNEVSGTPFGIGEIVWGDEIKINE